MFEDYPGLLVTKLYIPRVRSTHVGRFSLLAALDAGAERKLIVVATAAGFGKTTLLADWSSRRVEQIGWLSLDKGENDPVRFLSYLIAAVQTRHPQIGQGLLAALQSPQPPSIENALNSFLNQLTTVPDRLFLILDDYHVIENHAIHAALSFLLEHLPPQLTIVLLTRTDPLLPLSRLRARNDLLELRAAAMRFSLDETECFLNQTLQLDLAPEDIRALESHTEGWIAGLQLAAIAMQSEQGDKHTFIRNFTGSHRFVLDYLMEEVLMRQPEQVRQFLLHTSILRRLNGALCDAITGNTDGQAMLDRLEKNNLFIVPLDQSRYWYRYYHLFATLLQAHFQAEDPAMVKELQRRAARWHEQNNLPEEAVHYALTAQDFDHAAQLITGLAVGVTRRGEVRTLLGWYSQFPRDYVSHHASLSLQFGLAFALNGRWDEAERLLSYVEEHDSEVRPAETLLLAYLVASYRHDAARLEAIAEEAAASPNPDRVSKMVLALIVSLGGNWRYACQLMGEARQASEAKGDDSLALTALFQQCRLDVFAGFLHQAYELSQEALQRISELGNIVLPMATFVHVSLGRIWIEWNGLDKAAHHLSEAIRLSESSGFTAGILSSATMMLAEVKQAQGEVEEARQLADDAMAYAERYDPTPEIFWLKAYHSRLCLIQGNTTPVAEWLREAQDQHYLISMFYPNTIQKVTQARALLVQRKTEEAIALLTRLLTAPPDLLRVEALGLLALARQAQGDSVHALLTLEQALTQAEAENRVRAILDLGYPMAKLLARFCEEHPRYTFAQALLAAFSSLPDTTPTIEPFSERELEVLRLIAIGHSNEEIAQELTIAVSTVKWYINTLYGKLHVKSRSQAIARIHELKLLPN